jgi:hypothetical protein
MFLASLPFDYAKLVDRGDRVRTTRKRTADSRLRRTSPRGEA